MKHTFLILLSILSCAGSYSQRGYYATDSSITAGVTVLLGTDKMNSQYFYVKQKDQVEKFTPYDVTTYGIVDGRTYVAKEMQSEDSIRRVFMELLTFGELNYYYFQDRKEKLFFIEKNDTLIRIPEKLTDNDFPEILDSMKNRCPIPPNILEHVRYNTVNLSNFFTKYSECNLSYFPHLRYGFMSGFENSRLIHSFLSKEEELENFEFSFNNSVTAGIFLDVPIYASNFSIHTEAYYSGHKHKVHRQDETYDIDFSANIKALNIPLLVRYLYSRYSLKPFVNAGITFSYLFSNENTIYFFSVDDRISSLEKIVVNRYLPDKWFDYSVGGGFEYPVSNNHSVFIDFRYNSTLNKNLINELSSTKYLLKTGIIF